MEGGLVKTGCWALSPQFLMPKGWGGTENAHLQLLIDFFIWLCRVARGVFTAGQGPSGVELRLGLAGVWLSCSATLCNLSSPTRARKADS